MRRPIPFVLAAAILCSATSAIAAEAAPGLPTPNAQDLSGTRALAMGDAFRAVSSSNEAIYFNLAGLAQPSKYEIDLAYAFGGRELSRFNGSIVDSKSTRLATGLAYTRVTGAGLDGGLSGSIVNFGFGIPFADRVALGFGMKYLSFSGPDHTNAVTGDVGLLVRPFDYVSIGAAAYNVIDVNSREAPLRAGGGIAVGSDTSFRLAFDTVVDLAEANRTLVSYHAGGEYLFDGLMALRAGFKRLGEDNRNYVSGGIGLVSAAAAIEAAYVQGLTAGEGADRTLTFTLKFFL